MRIKKKAKALTIVADALIAIHKGMAMDGGTPWEGFVDLQAHDDQYHGGHYVEGESRCKLRESMRQAPDLLRQVGIELPDHAAIQARLQEASDAGLIDEQTANELSAIENDLRGQMNELDGGNVSLEQIGQTAMELNAVYSAIQEAMMAREDAHEAPQQQTQSAQQQTQAQPQQAQNAQQGGPWGSTGALPESHPVRQMNFNLAMANPSRTTGMPRAITDARQITPQVLADICQRLPSRGIINHRNRDVDFNGGRYSLTDAVKEMLVAPGSGLGAEMRRRFAAANQDNPWVRRLGECMKVLDRAREQVGAPNMTSAGRTTGEPDFASGDDAARYRPQIPAALRSANDAVMRDAGYQKIDSPSSRDFHDASNYRNRTGGFNCYLNDLSGLLTFLGYKVSPTSQESGHTRSNRSNFRSVKKALLAGGAKIFNIKGQTDNPTAKDVGGMVRKLNDMARTMPNGTWLSLWSGGHNKSAFLHNGKWYLLDLYSSDTTPAVTTPETIAMRTPSIERLADLARREDLSNVQGMTEQQILESGGGPTLIIDPSTFRITPELLQHMRPR